MQSLILSFWCVLSSAVFILGAVEYSNRWTVQIDGGINEADRLAQKHGFVNQGKIMDNYYSFEHHQVEKISHAGSAHLHKGLMSEANVKMVEQQELKSYDLLSSQSMDFHATDTRFEDMWYINRDDQPSYNVIDVWKRNITGEGVVVAVVDDGLEAEHPEIQGNYDQAASFDVVDNDTYPLPKNKLTQEYGHGTKCAGVIAAVLNNSNCGVGLAYKAHLGGIRLFENKRSTDADEARALSYAANHIHIYSNSWGPSDKGFRVAGPGYFTQNALKNGAEKGRRGLGSIYVFGAGNGGLLARDSCAFNGYVNSIYTIAISGIKSDGSIPIFGENCPGLMAVTYSRDVLGDSSKVITSGAKKSCTDTFTASSAAAAMASGLIALMMSANPELSWRDIQHIIVRTARPDPVGISGGDWSKNKAGLRMNDYVGFGLMDARGMVDAAINWTTVPPKVNCTIPRLGVNSRIPSRETLEETIDLSNWKDFCRDKINYLEHVEVSVNLNYSRRGDLLIKLISPQQTVSNLTHYRLADSEYGETDLNWVLMSLHHWGENATGVWKLRLHNSQLDRNNTGILFNWTLILHGTTLNPLDDNSHVNTTATPPPIKKPTNRTTTPQSKDVDECSRGNGGCSHWCVNTTGSYHCACPRGYRLMYKTCRDINECSRGNGGCSHKCVNYPGKYYCKCRRGYRLHDSRQCNDINECLRGNGGCTHGCVNTVGSYYCTCARGYQVYYKRWCTDTNECWSGNGGCSHGCVNTQGSYHCTCPRGYRLYHKTCTDINECWSGNGGCSHGCVNTRGSYHCTCPRGYRLYFGRRCRDKNECNKNNGGCSHRCVNAVGSHNCTYPVSR